MIIEHEFQQEIDFFVKGVDHTTRETFLQQGQFAPQLTALLFDVKRKTFTIAPILADPHLVNSEAGKDLLTKVIFPAILQQLNSKGQKVICTAMCIEAWITKVPFDGKEMPPEKELRRLQREASNKGERQEVLVIHYETELSSMAHMMDITRDAKGKPSLSAIESNDWEGVQGRFTGWLRKQPKMN